jgi:hypothetical protein
LRFSEELKTIISYMRRFRLTAQKISDIVHVPCSTVARFLKAQELGS